MNNLVSPFSTLMSSTVAPPSFFSSPSPTPSLIRRSLYLEEKNDDLRTSDGTHFQYSWIVAVVLAIVASTISNIGLNLQKLALNLRKQNETLKKGTYTTIPATNSSASVGAVVTASVTSLSGTEKAKPITKLYIISIWLLGMLGIVGGALCDFGALAFGAQSIVAPLGSWTLVANMVIAPAFLGEKISKRDLASTLVIVAGCTISVATAAHDEELFTIDQLYSLYTTIRFAGYATTILSIVLLMLLCIRYVERLRARYGKLSKQYNKWYRFHRFSYPCVSGILGAQSVLFAKTVVELVTISSSGGPFLLSQWKTYPILLGLTLSITSQIYYMQLGLARFDALICVPVFSCFWIFVSVCGGGIFYGEFSEFSTLQAVLFPVGVLLCCGGVYVLSLRETETELARRAHEEMGTNSNNPTVSLSTTADDEQLHTALLSAVHIPLSRTNTFNMNSNTSTLTTMNHKPMILVKESTNSSLSSLNAESSDDSLRLPGSSTTMPPPPPTTPLTREDAETVAALLTGLGEVVVTINDYTLNLTLRRTKVKLVDYSDTKFYRITDAWVLSSCELNTEDAISIGDLLTYVNDESVLDPWVTVTDVIRRIVLAPRPVRLTFRRIPDTLHRRKWLRKRIPLHAISNAPHSNIQEMGSITLLNLMYSSSNGKLSSSTSSSPLAGPHSALPLRARASTISTIQDVLDTSSAHDAQDLYHRMNEINLQVEGILPSVSTTVRTVPFSSSINPTGTNLLNKIIGGITQTTTQNPLQIKLSSSLPSQDTGGYYDDEDDFVAVPVTPNDAKSPKSRDNSAHPTIPQDNALVHARLLSTTTSSSSLSTASSSLGNTSSSTNNTNDYEFRVFVTDQDAISASASISRAHLALRNISMDPFAGLIHMGVSSLMGGMGSAFEQRGGGGHNYELSGSSNSGIHNGNRENSMYSNSKKEKDTNKNDGGHPIANAVLRILPPNRNYFNILDRVLDRLEQIQDTTKTNGSSTLSSSSSFSSLSMVPSSTGPPNTINKRSSTVTTGM